MLVFCCALYKDGFTFGLFAIDFDLYNQAFVVVWFVYEKVGKKKSEQQKKNLFFSASKYSLESFYLFSHPKTIYPIKLAVMGHCSLSCSKLRDLYVLWSWAGV